MSRHAGALERATHAVEWQHCAATQSASVLHGSVPTTIVGAPASGVPLGDAPVEVGVGAGAGSVGCCCGGGSATSGGSCGVVELPHAGASEPMAAHAKRTVRCTPLG
jgi:hypothetical protein